jgi:hypothetical protein
LEDLNIHVREYSNVLQGIRCEVLDDGFYLAQNSDKRWNVVNMAKDVLFPLNSGNFLDY